MIVAIHQPNYLPWLGYFHKIGLADTFIFLDDAQFSKNSYINRVQVMAPDGPKWLTVPVSVHLGDPIDAVKPARSDWRRAHLDSLRSYYRRAPAFDEVWPGLEAAYGDLPEGDLAASNRALVVRVAEALGLDCRFVDASALGAAGRGGDDRLVRLVAAVAPGGTYLSGKGGAKYQDPEKFAAAGLGFRYAGFEHPVYDQGGDAFTPGLSVVDAAFRLGWRQTAALLGW